MFEAGSLIYRIQTVGAGLFKAELQQAEEAAQKAARSLKQTASATRGLAEQGAYLRPRLHQVTGEIANMSQEAQGASREVGTAMTLIGAAIVATVGLTVKAATDWESAWAGVLKTVDGTDEELAGVEAGLRSMAKELPAAHGEIAAVAEAAGQLGVATENVVGFTRTMIDLGETTNLAAGTAATELARFMNVMGTAPDKVSNLGSAVVELGNNYATTEAEIVAMSQRLSGAARIVGLTEGETLGLAAALSSVGIEAEAGGTAVSKVMINIASAVDAGGDKVERFAEVAGMSAEDFSTAWRKDPGAALAAFVAGLSKMESQGKSTFAVLEGLGVTEQRMRDALLRASAASDQFTEAMQTGNTAFAENNALQEEAQKRYETTASKVAVARNAVVDMAIELGQHLLPLVAAAADGVKDLASVIGGLPEPVQGAVAITGLLVGAIFLAGGTALIAVPKFVAFRQAVQTLASTMPKTTAAVKGFATFMGGPWGVALTAAVISLHELNRWLESTRASGEEITAVLKSTAEGADILATASKGVSFEWAREQLQDLDAVLDRFDQLHKSTDRWERGGLEQTWATSFEVLKRVGEELGTLARADLPAAQDGFRRLAELTDGSDEKLWSLLQTQGDYKQSLIEAGLELGVYSESMSEAEKIQVLLDLAGRRNTATTESATDAYLAAADATKQMERTLDSLLSVLDEANGKNRDAISANIDYERTLRDAAEQIDKAGRGVDGFGMGLDVATEAGARNKEMLLDLAKDSRDAADATIALDGNVDDFLQRLRDGRQAIIDTAMGFGATREEAEKLADQIYGMPTEYEIEILASTSAAARMIDAFIATYQGKRITMSMFLQATGDNRGAAADAARLTGQALNSLRQADGGNIKFYGSGGEHHVAQFARAGDMRVWAEPETGGEWYIPDGAAKRPRSMALAEQMLNGWGYTMAPLGGGGGGQAVTTASQPVQVKVEINSKGSVALEDLIDVRIIANDEDTMAGVWGGQP